MWIRSAGAKGSISRVPIDNSPVAEPILLCDGSQMFTRPDRVCSLYLHAICLPSLNMVEYGAFVDCLAIETNCFSMVSLESRQDRAGISVLRSNFPVVLRHLRPG